ncbi:MAG: vitamin B12 dependent-methionine synthase activation domain-containing protein [Candidatus Omnitrophota bacterium]
MRKKGINKKKQIIPPFYGARSLSNVSIDEVLVYLDEKALFNVSWGIKLKDEQEKKKLFEKEYKPLLEELKNEAIRNGWLDLKAVYGYFKCCVHDENMRVYNADGKMLEEICFNRSKDGFSLADYFSKDTAKEDFVTFQAVTIGNKINNAIHLLNEKGEFTRAFLLHGLSAQIAEALAAYVHNVIRRELGLVNGQGARYSPGYPLWCNIEDQTKLFTILDIKKRIGVHLTEGYQMVPEQSTTAMIVIK